MRLARIFGMFLVASLSLCFMSAQQPAPHPTTDAQPITLDVVVTPKSGKKQAPVSGLPQQDFTVLDNNRARPIASFQEVSGPSAPISIILVVDAVNIDYTQLAFERDQIGLFLKSNGGHLAHPLSLAIFTDAGIEMQHAPSTDGNELSADLSQAQIGLRDIHRNSQFGRDDRVQLSLNALQVLAEKEASLPGRKLIFWVSPGWPLLSDPHIELDPKQQRDVFNRIVTISDFLRRSDITLYSIDPMGAGQNLDWEFAYQAFLNGVSKPGQADLADLSLQVLAVQSGGLAVASSNDVSNSLSKCMADTEPYYRITFDPGPADQPNQYHRIEIRLSAPGLVAHTRTGYYTESVAGHP